ncbi:MAG: hypothetical protein COA58_06685 [Bacteroidetes bacterium]|nr:MAG: hypothetical protein COA58_06685 [Bacteroidota bacterium]
MNRKMYRLIGLTLCVSMGWALGYLRLPYIERDYSFWLGFMGCLGFISFLGMLFFIWNNKTGLASLFRNHKTTGSSKKNRYSFIWVVSVLIIVSVLVFSIGVYKQNTMYKNQLQTQSIRLKEQSQMIVSVRQSKLMSLMKHILDKVENEVNSNPNKALSDETIDRIVTLSSSFKPYKSFEKDSVSEKELSPERGQLLLALSIIKMDSNSFSRIRQSTSFSQADLTNADLQGIDLSGIDLSGANIEDANLSWANLKGANLRGVNLSRANLTGADLTGADLKRANLSWAELNEADLKQAVLNGADLTNAKLRKADLRDATIHWAELNGVMLNEADLTGCDLKGVGMVNTNLTNANLTEIAMSGVDLSEAILVGMVVDEDWLDNLKEWNITGAEEIVKRYKVLTDTLEGKEQFKYRLAKVLN